MENEGYPHNKQNNYRAEKHSKVSIILILYKFSTVFSVRLSCLTYTVQLTLLILHNMFVERNTESN